MKYSLRGLGFDTFQTNLLVIPSQALSIINLLFFTRAADWTGRLAFNGIIGQIWALPFLVSLYVLNTTTANKWVIWTIITLLLSYPSNHSVQVGRSPINPPCNGVSDQHYYSLGWASRNANTVRTRTVSTAMYNMCVQASAIIYSNIYRQGKFFLIYG